MDRPTTNKQAINQSQTTNKTIGKPVHVPIGNNKDGYDAKSNDEKKGRPKDKSLHVGIGVFQRFDWEEVGEPNAGKSDEEKQPLYQFGHIVSEIYSWRDAQKDK